MNAQVNELGRAGRIRILLICCSSLLIVGIDVTGVNVALPAIGHDLHTGISGLQWVIDAYTLVLASLLMLAGSIADRFGRKRVFITGLSVFGAASALCSLAPDPGLLVAFRALQAIGGAMLNPVAMSIITNTFTDPKERVQAIGVWGAVVGISMALGPVVGGGLVSALSWRMIFLVNVPVAVIAIALALRYVPESRSERARRLDPVAQLLVIAMLATVTYAIIEGPSQGWGSVAIVGSFVVSAAALISLGLYESRRTEPLIDPRFFRSVPFSAAVFTAICAFAAFGAFLFLNTLYLQDVRGFSAVTAGLTTLPMAVMVMIVSPLSGRIVGRHGPRVPMVLAGTGMAAGAALLAGLAPGTPVTLLILAYAIFGAGFGLVNAPITNAAVSGMPRAQAGVAAAIASTSRQLGSTLGVAVAGAIVASSARIGAGSHIAAASHPGWWTISGCGVLVIGLGVIAASSAAQRSARRTASSLNPEALTA